MTSAQRKIKGQLGESHIGLKGQTKYFKREYISLKHFAYLRPNGIYMAEKNNDLHAALHAALHFDHH